MNRLLGLGVLMSAVFIATETAAQSNDVGEQSAQADAGQESKDEELDRLKTSAEIEVVHTARAKRYMRGVFGGDVSVVTELAADDIVMSWPIFERLYKTRALRGRDAVKKFVTNFSRKWSDTHITFHETVVENDKVVLIWDFQAKNIASKKTHGWGGISFYHFDEDGKIVEEIGEESTPGPVQRLQPEKPAK